jgi:hypothetical protein
VSRDGIHPAARRYLPQKLAALQLATIVVDDRTTVFFATDEISGTLSAAIAA